MDDVTRAGLQSEQLDYMSTRLLIEHGKVEPLAARTVSHCTRTVESQSRKKPEIDHPLIREDPL